MDRFQVAPVRKLDDFLLETDRFKVSVPFVLLLQSMTNPLVASLLVKLPDFSNLSKWNSRVNGNLLYYQTNYMITTIVLFTIIA